MTGRTAILFSLAFVMITCGCAATITSFTDDISKADIVRMTGNRLGGELRAVELNVQRYEKKGQISYSLFVVSTGPTLIMIDPGKSLVLEIDGVRKEISGSGSQRHRGVLSLGLAEEVAYYHDVDQELIRSIAYAKKVDVELHGSGKVLNRYFKKKNINNFRLFYDTYIKNDKEPDVEPEGDKKLHNEI
jgi:hypothetical protein